MGFSIREIDAERKLCQELTLDALHGVIAPQVIDTVLQLEEAHAVRERKLTMVAVVWILIAMNLYTTLALEHVIRKVGQGLRFIWPDPTYPVPGDSAPTYRRYPLGARPMATLFHHVCHPIATPQTPGAFLFGLRLMALDGTVEAVPDTAANGAIFGRLQAQRGTSAFPQVQGVYLVECGTHVIVDAGFWPYATSERVGGFRVLRSVTPEMLVMWDRGFHDYEMLLAVRQRGAHALGRLPAHVTPQPVQTLADGSVLAYLTPSDYQRRNQGERLLVRIIEYTLTDPALPGSGQRYRVVPTLVDPTVAPARELACADHERWEIEVVIDAVDTHQRLAGRPLRSHKPVGVIQELSGLLLAHYAIRFLMHAAALQAGVDPDRLSFVHALRVLQDAMPELQMTARAERPRLYARLLQDIAAGQLPARQTRANPRVVKRKMSKVRLKRPAHRQLPQPQGSFREAVMILAVPEMHAETAPLDRPEWLYSEPLEFRQHERCRI